jgi:hypothetical protein
MTKQLTHLHLEAGPGGWVKAFWRREAGSDSAIFVRFRGPQKKGERWTIIGLQVPKGLHLHTALLDDVPRHQIELAANASEVIRDGLRTEIDEPTPVDLDGAFKRAYREAERPILVRPPRNQIDDAFLRQVSFAYRQAIAAGLPPLKTMADDSGIPQGTIARWVAKAREPERGFLPPAEPGKVSA